LNLKLNGKNTRVEVEDYQRLLDILRDKLNLTGTKEGCGEGECGACSVMMNDLLVNSCLVPAFQVDGAKIETIEYISKTPLGEIIVDSFCSEGAVQCGFCTPGFVVSAYALLKVNANPTEQEIKTAISGNLCRCTGYTKIVQAIRKASEKIS